jgi:tRNA (cmo5U34)-methyltransferase
MSDEIDGVADDPVTANAPDPGEPWTFDEAVAQSFEDMLSRSIPNYADMRRFVTEAAVHHARLVEKTGGTPVIVDLGASRGSALKPIVDRLGMRAQYEAVEISEPMLAELEARFEGWRRVLNIHAHDLREGWPDRIGFADVVISSLTVQFVPIEYRQRLLRDVVARLRPGGILILVEKVLPAGAELESLMNEVYWSDKERNGYTREAIDRKRLSLEGVLVPLTARFNEDLLDMAGFATVDVGWAWGPFRAWLALKR